MGPSFFARFREVFGLDRFSLNIFLNLGLNMKFGLNRFSVHSGFGLDRFHCTNSQDFILVANSSAHTIFPKTYDKVWVINMWFISSNIFNILCRIWTSPIVPVLCGNKYCVKYFMVSCSSGWLDGRLLFNTK